MEFQRNELLINSRVVLFGAGKIGQSYLKDWKRKRINVVCWGDNIPGKIKMFEMMPEHPEVIRNIDFDYVVCGVKGEMAFKAIKTQLLRWEIDERKILWEKLMDIWIEYLCN